MAQPAPLKTFVIYARSDEAYKQQLLLHLRPLLNSRLLSVWHDGNILPGEDWEKAIKKELKSSDLVLVLVSAHSLNSEFIQTQELRTALDRLRDGLARVVPIIVSPCGWKFDPVLAGLQALPLFGSEGPKPVNDRVWQNTDEAWANVIDHLGDMVLELHKQRGAAARAEEERESAAAAALLAQQEAEREAQHKLREQQQAEETARREATARLVREQRDREAADLAAEAPRAKEAAQQAEAVAQREREEQTRREAAAQVERQKQAQQEKQRLEKDQLTQQTRDAEQARQRAEQERDRQWHEAHATAWAAATEQHSAAAYEQFLSRYPNSANAREARHHIKTLRQEGRRPLAWGKWAGIGAAVLAVAFLAWKLTQPSASDEQASDGLTSSQPITPSDTLRPSQPAEAAKTLSPEKLPDNTGVKKDEPTAQPTTDPAKPAFVFDYKMVRVEGGSYTMGQPDPNIGCNACSADECPHSVGVATFSIGQTEVTQAQWKAVMDKNPSNFKGDNLPVESVSWNDVQAFIKKLNEKTGLRYRLPTEKEWEYAARGGASSRKTKYSGSDDIGSVAWYGSNSDSKTHPVAAKKANELGIFDMSGNIWEWCQDKYGPYPGCSEPKQTGSGRVVRGGSWNYLDCYCRSANRFVNEPDVRFFNFGFRLAQD